MDAIGRAFRAATGSRRSSRSDSSSRSSSSSSRRRHAPPHIGPVPIIRDEFQANYARLQGCVLMPTSFLDLEACDALHIRSDIDLLVERAHWGQFIEIREPVYTEITLEFLSSLNVRATGQVGSISFRLMNQTYSMTIPEFGRYFGFPEGNLLRKYPTNMPDLCVFWNAIACQDRVNRGWVPGDSSEHCIINLTFRVLHRVLSECLFARFESVQKVKQNELLIMWCLVNNRCPDSAYFLAKELVSISRKKRGAICIGGLITRIARVLEIDLSGCTLVDPAHPFHLIGIPRLINMRHIFEVHPGRIRVNIPGKSQAIEWHNRYTITEERNWKDIFADLENDRRGVESDDHQDEEENEEDETETAHEAPPLAGQFVSGTSTSAGTSRAQGRGSRSRQEYSELLQQFAGLRTHSESQRMSTHSFIDDHFSAFTTHVDERFDRLDARLTTLETARQRDREEDARRMSISEGMLRQMYHQQFGYYYDPNMPYPPPPPH